MRVEIKKRRNTKKKLGIGWRTVPQRHIATYSAYNNAGKGNERGLGLLAYYTKENLYISYYQYQNKINIKYY